MADTINEFTMHRIFDAHCHFRQGELLALVLPLTAQYARYGLAMPNTRPRAILTAEDVVWYWAEIERTLDRQSPRPLFEPLMTIEVRDSTTPQIITAAKKAGAVAGKVYPLGVTTNSEEGLRNFWSPGIQETFRVMEEVGMLLLLHGELDMPRVLVTEREQAFLPTLIRLAEKFPKLKIVLEHVSTIQGILMVKQLGENVGATITAHHLCLTLNDVIGQPHNTCMPVAKSFNDRDALVWAATSGDPKFFLGSDTAPHPRHLKECAKGKSGIFTAPVLPSLLAKIFEEQGCFDRLDYFASGAGPEFYGLPPIEETINMVKEPWTVPEQYGEGDNIVVPFMAGEELEWRLVT